MYQSPNLTKNEHGHFMLSTTAEKYKILQLTDLHLGCGWLSKKQDMKAWKAVDTLIRRSNPNLIAFTGDCIFPFLPKAGTRNNIKQLRQFIERVDAYQIPYTFIFGNHDVEMGAKGNKNDLSEQLCDARYAIFDRGPEEITGASNYIVHILREQQVEVSLVMLDSNMYRDGWFYSGFDCIRSEQSDWAIEQVSLVKAKQGAMAFFHMPLPEFKEAYRKMKLGDKQVIYQFGCIGEKNDYFGITKYDSDFFEKAKASGLIQYMFCGHDHLNTLSLTYQGIQMTYGMSIDYLGYRDIGSKYTQRGGTLITIPMMEQGEILVEPVPYTTVVSTRVRGKEKENIEEKDIK